MSTKNTWCLECDCKRFKWAHWKEGHVCECGHPATKHNDEEGLQKERIV